MCPVLKKNMFEIEHVKNILKYFKNQVHWSYEEMEIETRILNSAVTFIS